MRFGGSVVPFVLGGVLSCLLTSLYQPCHCPVGGIDPVADPMPTTKSESIHSTLYPRDRSASWWQPIFDVPDHCMQKGFVDSFTDVDLQNPKPMATESHWSCVLQELQDSDGRASVSEVLAAVDKGEMCLVDTLDPKNYFRLPFMQNRAKAALGGIGPPLISWKEQMRGWFLGRSRRTTSTGRRVYIDLGMNRFSSSVLQMLTTYPGSFTEVHTIEGEAKFIETIPTDDEFQKLPHVAALKLPKNFMTTQFHFTHGFVVGAPQDESKRLYNLVDYLTAMKLKDDDFVVLKMDVEGHEYALLEVLLESGLHHLIDEAYLEIHMFCPLLAAAGWCRDRKHPRQRTVTEANDMLQKVRNRGLRVLLWP